MIYRKAEKNDIAKIVDLRVSLLVEEAVFEPTNIEDDLREYFSNELNKSTIVMLAEDNGKIVSTSSVIFQQFPPTFNNKQGLRAYVNNVYTVPEYRRKGISTMLLNKLVKEVKARNISYIWLWATEEGVHLYKKYGFNEIKAFSTMGYYI